MRKLRILIADDHEWVRRGIREVLRSRHCWSIVGEAANGLEAVKKAIELKPDVAVIDIGMPRLDGIEAVRLIKAAVPDTKILVLTMQESDHTVRRALGAGASGYFLKSDLSDSLINAVKAVAEGNRFLTAQVSEIVLDGFIKSKGQHPSGGHASTRTTPRETEIIRLLAEGKTNKEIAELLGIAVRTVETHRAKIMLKLGLHSVAEIIHYAMRHGLALTQVD